MSPGYAQDTSFLGENYSNIEPQAGSNLTLDEALDIDMPEKWSLDVDVRRSYLNSDEDYLEKVTINGEQPSSGMIFGFGINYKF